MKPLFFLSPGGVRAGMAAVALAATSMATAAAAAQADADVRPAPLKVVTSFSILEDITREVGGGDVEVASLVGRDGDSHAYEPTPSDARRLAAAQVLVTNGLDFEAWLPRLVKAAGFQGRTIIASEGVQPLRFAGHGHGHAAAGHDHKHGHDGDHGHDDHDHDHDHDHGHGHGHAHGEWDPHAWQDLSNGARYAMNIAEGLAAADPARAGAYRERAGRYAARLKALDAKLKEAFAALPAERRRAVVSHEAFAYFGQAYGLELLAVSGLSTDSEPSATSMARLIETVRARKVPAVFVENVSSPRLVDQIVRETGAKVGGTLYSDALSEPGQPAATYLDMFEWNASRFLDALRP